MELIEKKGSTNTSDPSRVRPGIRVLEKDRKRDATGTDGKNVIGRLDSEAFKRRSRYLREIYLNPEKRHLYDWTNLEKKILLLDWHHNPSFYEKWKPLETEDMMNRFYSNMIYNFMNLSMTNVGTTPVYVRLLNHFQTFRVTYQCLAMIQRYFRSDSTFYDEFKIAWICRDSELKISSSDSGGVSYKQTSTDEYQCIVEGVNFNIFTITTDEFEKFGPCQECLRHKVVEKTTLRTPKIVFPLPVTAMEVTTTLIDNVHTYLLVVRMANLVRMYDITKMIQKTLEICKLWDEARQIYLKRYKEARKKLVDRLCTGCILTNEDFQRLDKQKQLLRPVTLVKPHDFKGLDFGESTVKTMSTKRNTSQTGLKFFYTSFLKEKRVLPTYLGCVGVKRACVWEMYEVKEALNDPLITMELEDEAIPTDLSASLSVVKSSDDFREKKWVVEPKIYSTDDKGYLRLWNLSKGLECSLKLDSNALLTLDVNKKYPHLIALGGDTGKLKIYNLHIQSMASSDQSNLELGLLTVSSYIPNTVYQYMNWYHPLVKVKWVNDVFVAAQYSEPFFNKESTNSATLAIWNVYKDIFDKEDAFLSNKYWSQSMESVNSTYHLGSKLICIYGGHFGSLGGILSSDVNWSEDHGIIAVSSDNTGQLHWYKPGIWNWANSDDPMCLARIKSNVAFHQDILDKVNKEHSVIIREVSGISHGTSNYRKTRSNYTQYLNEAMATLEQLGQKIPLLNDFKSLPSWAKKTLRLTTDEEKYMKMIKKEADEREKLEHYVIEYPVQRSQLNEIDLK
ncbi:hypothetical protein TpMuguga_04g00647 [Theileria parva strain Muguga]|uniref:Uncharacterized protein n=1 Tax=Theileria parva TaxID=5875 RepID=Q4N1T3_THEPA|nr:uncharacterized protein TpMuguga_04g00647 [Theileria parva strain Muguga]EAN31999.1 hypothetical protein TpMuguga_04g00647 [Theileria parva strain Muguga]|eukprot:XP_764282.1 hypothetical protein [Theileria parva strain Muguga]